VFLPEKSQCIVITGLGLAIQHLREWRQTVWLAVGKNARRYDRNFSVTS
jgi:hypothetical protein